LKVRLSLNQASKKKSRRLTRAAKAAAIAPRPLQKLRPLVHCQTQRYNSKVRLGKGFSLAELSAAKLSASYARSVGIAVDHRRTNKSNESLELNVARLEQYKSNLVVFGKSKPTDVPGQLTGTVMPIVKATAELEMQAVTDEMKEFKAFTTMRNARKESKVAGYRIAAINAKKKE